MHLQQHQGRPRLQVSRAGGSSRPCSPCAMAVRRKYSTPLGRSVSSSELTRRSPLDDRKKLASEGICHSEGGRRDSRGKCAFPVNAINPRRTHRSAVAAAEADPLVAGPHERPRVADRLGIAMTPWPTVCPNNVAANRAPRVGKRWQRMGSPCGRRVRFKSDAQGCSSGASVRFAVATGRNPPGAGSRRPGDRGWSGRGL